MSEHLSPTERLQLDLPGLDWITDSNRVARLSQDFSWFSPVLKSQLKDKSADIVVRPRTEDEVRAVVRACVRLRMPITIRGAGTGNYGQAIPLSGGLVLDLTSFNELQWVRPGAARARAGIRLGELEKRVKLTNQELRCIPSTYRSATLGGLFGGGFGGIGSINYGPLAAPGNVTGIRAMTIEAEPQVVELRGEDALRMHHMWGTNGLVLEIEIALAPAHPWLEVIATFDDFNKALAFGDVVANAPGMIKREVAFFAKPIPDLLVPLAAHLPPGCHAVLALLSESSEDTFLQFLARHGGTLSYRKTADEAQKERHNLSEFTWNHTTLNALKSDPTLTYLQSIFVPGRHVEQIVEMEKIFSGEVFMHSEWLRILDGRITCSALQLVRYTTEARLNEIIALTRAHGVRISNPHVFIVEDGEADGMLPIEALELKKRFDPDGLLNPGKLRDWPLEEV